MVFALWSPIRYDSYKKLSILFFLIFCEVISWRWHKIKTAWNLRNLKPLCNTFFTQEAVCRLDQVLISGQVWNRLSKIAHPGLHLKQGFPTRTPLQIYVGDMFTVDYGKNIFKYFIKSRTNVSLFVLGKRAFLMT